MLFDLVYIVLIIIFSKYCIIKLYLSLKGGFVLIDTKEQKVYDLLNELKIKFTIYKHKPIYSIDEIKELNLNIPGIQLKNLFLRNKKGNEHYLVIVEENKKVNLKELAQKLSTSSLSFASEKRLLKYLGVSSGSVTPFGLINDFQKNVKVFLDNEILSYNQVSFHPNVNTATVLISYLDFERYLKFCENEFVFIDIK